MMLSGSLRRMWILLVVCLMLVGSGIIDPKIASAADPFPKTIPLPTGFRPEGITMGRGTDFYVGSRHGSPAAGTIYRGDIRTGTGNVLVPPREKRAALGLKFDPRTNYLFVAGGPTGLISVYNAETGSVVAEYQIAGAGFINDEIIAPDAVYFTDSFQPVLYRLPLGPNGEVSPEAKVETIQLSGEFEFKPNALNANGIVPAPDGKSLILVHANLGRLYQVDPKTGKATQINLGNDNVRNGDGLALSDHTLFVVQNFDNQISVVQLDPSLTSGTVLSIIKDPNLRVPATAALFGNTLYLVNARFNVPPADQPNVDYDVVRVDVNLFRLKLAQGLNMISLPLKPSSSYTARSLAKELGATIVIKLDEGLQLFRGFTLEAPDDGFAIEGGKGYIVNLPTSKQATFVGAAWTSSLKSPPLEAVPSQAFETPKSAWAFVVSGRMATEDEILPFLRVTVRNTRTNALATDVVRSGYFASAFADLRRQSVVEVGDRLEITVTDGRGEIAAEPVQITVTPEALHQAFVSIRLRGVGKPNHSLLLQNYPNPFNPETWIPYQLKEAAFVVIRIYDAKGGLVRRLDLERQEAGFYRSRSRAAYWDGRNDMGERVSSGIYFYHFQAGDYSAMKKMIILK